MSSPSQVAVIIPSLDPDPKLTHLVEGLQKAGFTSIIVVNDGSGSQSKPYYEACRNMGCHVIDHAVNWGKGRALKSAFNFFLNELPNCSGAVTVDSDGQHSVQDTIRCADALLKHPDSLILGCRDFHAAQVPTRSRFGNLLTRKILKILCGVGVTDTQTGLRGYPREVMLAFMDCKGERFEFETNTLIETKEKNIPIFEVPIQTIYLEQNSASHFNPIVDSLRIYAVFGKFLFSSLSSFVLDILLFTLFIRLIEPFSPYYIVLSTVLARILSAVFNFFLNKNRVFHAGSGNGRAYLRYALLSLVQMSLSAAGVFFLYRCFPIAESLLKVIVDSILFLLSFQIQREWVFERD